MVPRFDSNVWLRLALKAGLGVLLGAATAAAQVHVQIDAPSNGASVSQSFTISGWALEWQPAAGSGIDAIHVYAAGPIGNGVLLGAAQLGIARPDVGQAFGNPRFNNSGYQFNVNLTNAPPGNYTFGLFAHSTASGQWGGPFVFSATLHAAPLVAIDPITTSVQPFVLTGAAGDPHSTSGPGVSAVHVYAHPTDGSPVRFIGAATTGISRPDLAAVYGAQFLNAGWQIRVTGLPPGQYTLAAYALGTVTGQWGATTRDLPVLNDVRAVIEQPANLSAIRQPFTVSGAAADLAAAAGTGVSSVMVGMYNQQWVLAGAFQASYGIPRPDLAAIAGSPQFTNVGYSATVSGLAPGTYNLVVYAHSDLSGWTPFAISVNVDLKVATPVASPPPGQYSSPLTVSLSDATPGATIHVTTDGSEPTQASPIYTGPVTITSSGSGKAKAFKAGYVPSDTLSLNYTLLEQVQPPGISPWGGTFSSETNATVYSATPGATFYYTLDGTAPSASSPTTTGAIPVTTSAVLRVRAHKAGMAPSTESHATFTLVAQQPGVTPNGGSFTGSVSVVAQSPTPGATVHYTLNGSEPTQQSPQAGALIVITQSATLRARAYRAGWSPSPIASAAFTINEEVEAPSPVQLTMTGAIEGRFNPINSVLRLTASGGTLDVSDPPAGFVNGQRLAAGVTATTGTVILSGALLPGFNLVEVVATDSGGRRVHWGAALWAGGRSVSLTIQDSVGGTSRSGVVRYSLGEGFGVSEQVAFSTGRVTLTSLPPVSVSVSVELNRSGVIERALAILGSETARTLQTTVSGPDNATNLDFSQGLSHWATTSGVSLVARAGDEIPDASPASELYDQEVPKAPDSFQEGPRGQSAHFLGNVGPVRPPAPAADGSGSADMFLYTSGQYGMQWGQSRIITSPGTSFLVLRYRYTTLEVPYGYFGTVYDDYFGVVAIAAGGGAAHDVSSMNSLGLGAFDASGATVWRELIVRTSVGGDQVDVTFAVANAVDNLYDSSLTVTALQLRSLGVTAFDLRDVDGQVLAHLSASPHTYYGGKTVVNGTMEIGGPATTSLADATLEVFEGTRRVAIGRLSAGARAALLGPFGSSQRRSGGSPSAPLFEIDSGQFSAVNQGGGGQLTYKIVARSADGRVAESELRSAIKLIKVNGSRYGPRDIGDCIVPAGGPQNYPCGGDDWGRPAMQSNVLALGGAGVTFNDISNMNGGPFPIHATHQTGVDADLRFADGTYPARNAAVAARLVNIVNMYGLRVQQVFVTYTAEFRNAIHNARLADGRWARDVFRNVQDHADHFHIMWRQQ